MKDHTLAGLAPDVTLEPRVRALIADLPADQARVLEDLWRDREQLVALAERARLVLQSASDAILVTSLAGVVESANEAAGILFGKTAPMRGTKFVDLVAREEQGMLREYLQRALGGDLVRTQLSVPRTDGDHRKVHASISPIRELGKVTGMVVSLNDYTDEARARDEVAAANARYRDLVDVAADAIWTLDRRGLFTSVNPSTLELTQSTQAEMLGRSAIPLLDPDDQQRVAHHIQLVLQGKRQRYECQLVRRDGSRRLISVANSPVVRQGEVVGVLGVARDVTEERAQAAALERAEARYTRLVESAEDGIATMDEEGNLTSVNRALERVSGRPRAALLGAHFIELIAPPERAVMWRLFAATLGGERQRREMRFTRPDGRAGIATVISAPIIEHGRISGVLAIARDVTDERLLFDQVTRREKLAALGELVGGVAHEINTPLTGILAFAQILVARASAKNIDAEARQAAESIVHEAKRAARIVTKLLTFARQNPPERLPTDINQVIEDTIELRRYPLRVQEIELDVELDRSLPSTWADPFQLQQVFLNLLSNAEQAVSGIHTARRITVRSRREGDNLVAEFRDSGSGIAPEHLPHIFNPFYTTKPRGIGTGLGLSIADGIIREHHGTIRVHSEVGQGALFEVVLPLVASSVKSPN
jgi:PAS domain S-box-containing protein